MAMSEDDRKEIKGLLAESFAEGIALFRSKAEEEDAKNKVTEPPADKGGNSDSGNGGFSLQGFLLGGR